MDWCNDNVCMWTYRNYKKMKKFTLFLPLIVLIFIAFFLFIFLLKNIDPSKPPSALLNENLPKFIMVDLFNNKENISDKDLKEKTIIINFFASWCIPCKTEHPIFFNIKKEFPDVYLVGINHKDELKDALTFLKEDGNPYDKVGIDNKGSVGLEFGVFGLPETFLVDVTGKIIYKHLGPLTNKIFQDEIKPFLTK